MKYNHAIAVKYIHDIPQTIMFNAYHTYHDAQNKAPS